VYRTLRFRYLNLTRPERASTSGRRASLGVFDYVVDCRGEIINSGAWDDDRVSAAVGFLRNTKKFTPVVLAEFDVEMLPFDLQLPGFDEIIHALQKTAEFRPHFEQKGSSFFGVKTDRL